MVMVMGLDQMTGGSPFSSFTKGSRRDTRMMYLPGRSSLKTLLMRISFGILPPAPMPQS